MTVKGDVDLMEAIRTSERHRRHPFRYHSRAQWAREAEAERDRMDEEEAKRARILIPLEDVCRKLDHRVQTLGPPYISSYEEACVDCTLAWRRAERRQPGSGDAAVNSLRDDS